MAMNRRRFLEMTAAAGAGFLFSGEHWKAAAALKGKVKITGVKTMIIRGTWDWNLIKIETDQPGLYGIGEAYWGPGVNDMIHSQLKQFVIGEDPLNVDKLYTKMLMRSGGYGAIGGVTVTAASGIEIALWDLAGRILETPVCNLLGGRFRDKVRFYRTMQSPTGNLEDMSRYKDFVAQARAEKWNWTAFKFQGDQIPGRVDPSYSEPGHDPYGRALTSKDIRRIVNAMETVRGQLGPDIDFGIEAHW
jgi:L-alanine-DL-glutamate epimerase-like enolase superfamily enzyme